MSPERIDEKFIRELRADAAGRCWPTMHVKPELLVALCESWLAMHARAPANDDLVLTRGALSCLCPLCQGVLTGARVVEDPPPPPRPIVEVGGPMPSEALGAPRPFVEIVPREIVAPRNDVPAMRRGVLP